jgi:hypothetical protein
LVSENKYNNSTATTCRSGTLAENVGFLPQNEKSWEMVLQRVGKLADWYVFAVEKNSS